MTDRFPDSDAVAVVGLTASAGRSGVRRRRWLRRAMLAVLVLLAFFAIGFAAHLGHRAGERQGIAAARDEANHRLELFASAVDGVIRRLAHVPATVQLHQDVVALLRDPAHPRLADASNLVLRRLNAHIGSLAAYVLNDRGVVVASSNLEDDGDDSSLGQDLSFRPYFLEALSGRVGRHFAIGMHHGVPGYFVSHPIYDGPRVLGVAAIKISLQPIDDTWGMLGAPALLADTNGVVVLASNRAWRYTALTPLPIERRVDLQLTRTYNNLAIRPFPLADALPRDREGALPSEPAVVAAAPTGSPVPQMLVLSRAVDGMDWRALLFYDLDDVRRQALTSAALAAVAAASLLLLALLFAQRRRIARQRLEARRLLERVNAELERKVALRTQDLTETNERLRREVREREQAERNLRETHDELIQAAKLAVLGRLATGITHELTQPLGAIRTLSGNAVEFLRRGNGHAASDNLELIGRLSERMGGIIHPLRGFARKSQPVAVAVDVALALGNALFLLDVALRRGGVAVDNRCRPGQVRAWCDANRLEQVLINLIGNAIDAMAEAPVRRLTLSAECRDEGGRAEAWIDVLDTGSGLGEQVRQQLFEPFFTTKGSGAGLGLGLVISREIAHEFDGEIEADNRPEGGACFRLRLPAAPAPSDAA